MSVFENMGVATEHVFSCEKKDILRRFAEVRFKPLRTYEDMTVRPNEVHNPAETDLDFYVAGLACQSFSIAGNNLGTKDPRGQLFQSCLDFLRHRVPRSFILENVKNLVEGHQATFQAWLQQLQALHGAFAAFIGKWFPQQIMVFRKSDSANM